MKKILDDNPTLGELFFNTDNQTYEGRCLVRDADFCIRCDDLYEYYIECENDYYIFLNKSYVGELFHVNTMGGVFISIGSSFRELIVHDYFQRMKAILG